MAGRLRRRAIADRGGLEPGDSDRRLAVYGSLAPGRANHHRLEALEGDWFEGVVYGHLEDRGWGAALGYPALVHDPSGPPVHVWVLESAGLADRWRELDRFEGPAYVRRVVTVFAGGRRLCRAQIYLARPA